MFNISNNRQLLSLSVFHPVRIRRALCTLMSYFFYFSELSHLYYAPFCNPFQKGFSSDQPVLCTTYYPQHNAPLSHLFPTPYNTHITQNLSSKEKGYHCGQESPYCLNSQRTSPILEHTFLKRVYGSVQRRVSLLNSMLKTGFCILNKINFIFLLTFLVYSLQ